MSTRIGLNHSRLQTALFDKPLGLPIGGFILRSVFLIPYPKGNPFCLEFEQRSKFVGFIGTINQEACCLPLFPPIPVHHILKLAPSALLWGSGQDRFLRWIPERQRDTQI